MCVRSLADFSKVPLQPEGHLGTGQVGRGDFFRPPVGPQIATNKDVLVATGKLAYACRTNAFLCKGEHDCARLALPASVEFAPRHATID